MKTEYIRNRILSFLIGLTIIQIPSFMQDQGTVYFNAIIAGTGAHHIIYKYHDPESLYSGYDTAFERISVVKEDIVFPDDKQFYCLNDESFTITGTNNANKIGSFSIEGGVGLTDNHNNTATIHPKLLSVDNYTITYTYVHGTTRQITENFTIGNKPDANFIWENECFQAGQAIILNDNSVSNGETITGYKWLFYHGSDYDSLMTKNVSYTFPQPGNYVIKLQLETSIGCSDTIAKVFALRPTIQLAGQTYFEDFEDRPIAWQSGTSHQNQVNSWSLKEPVKGYNGASSGYTCWFTDVSYTNPLREQSWVTSPCFDFRGTERPMIKLDIWRLFDFIRDGATLQASADSGRTWQNLGELHDGINWFNEYDILGTPGGQSIGWSNIRDTNWIESRHSLDEYRDKSQVQFRIAYGSDGTARNTDGLAFDNVWIGERNKVALIEHFTNASDPSSRNAGLSLNELIIENSANVIDLQYHTSFPGTDPFNQENPHIPGARLLYYGLYGVPYSLLDGGIQDQHRFDYESSLLDIKTVLIQSLIDSRFNIAATSDVVGNTLHVEAEMLALQDVPSSELTLHLAVIEREITGVTGNNGETVFYSVVKTMLPDAGGTTFNQAWDKGESQYVYHSWNMQHMYNLDELRIVAFIQDESTKEVYQSSINTVHIKTGIEDSQESHQDMPGYFVFFNPVSSYATIRFREPVRQDIKLELYNYLGSMIYSGHLSSGEIQIEVSVADCPDGIYMIRLTGNKMIGTSKLTISR